ncbi:LacI family DNA-binding transcriptional regulator [Nocardioides sp. CER19]|uniref:LacI family DNA-binding transcriptional regulator n=1 Tax=Nocardioides sp. CER19 TaxID=3038538 RepID=UPI00244B37E5|nr:LacI family DNA-binding transcriptional regulator [Nocardioides sp. CER19]MDH2416228.1 LacI family DNA-binding transcriptional regulator [Nocardioides sp. CER19]
MANIADVAKAAGVSASTVSYVLSGKRTISKETADRVHRAIREMDYRPNAGARALASARTNIIGLVVPLRAGQNVPVVMEFVAAVVTRARSHDHDVLLLTQDEGVDGLRRVAASALVDALIVMDVQAKDPRLTALRSLDTPAVLIGVPERSTGLSAVDLDFAAAGSRAIEHLAELGHRRIGFIGQPPKVYERGTGYAERLLTGLHTAAAEHDVTLSVAPCESSMAGLRASVTQLLDEQPGLTALIVHNESVLPALREVLLERERRLPDDVAVVAICPDDMASSHGIDYTNIAIPADELGTAAVDMVMSRLPGKNSAETRLLAPDLTVRDTTPDLKAR